MTNHTSYDVAAIRNLFPILNRKVKGKDLVYFDNAATSQKPIQVIDALVHYYSHYNANIHRGLHTLADEATAAYEASRVAVQQFIGAREPEEIIFTKGTTESINIVAKSWGKAFLEKGDEIIITSLEHHANIVPWQMIAEEKGAVLRVIPMDQSGILDMDAYKRLLNNQTRFVSLIHVSNALGVINPVEEMITLARQYNAKVLIDGAQSSVHLDIDVQQMDCDFYVFSGHKIYGPTGVGVLYGKRELLEQMPPFLGGGEMIKEVTFEELLINTQCEFEEKKLPLSKDFWNNYENIKTFKPNYKTGRSDIALEAKALENLKVYLKVLPGNEENLAYFVKMLLKDLKKYHTLSIRTLGRLGRKTIDIKSSEKEIKALTNEINWVRNHFGDDYLDRILKRVDNQKNEVIIAVENDKIT
jgi:hypothetical protein